MPIVILVVLVVVVAVVVAVVRSRGGDDDATGTVDVERRLTSTVQPVGLVGDPTAKKVDEPAKPAPLPTMPAVSRAAPAESDAADAGTAARQDDPVVFEPDLSRFDGSPAERKPIDLPWPDVDGSPKHVPAEPAGSGPAASETVGDEPAPVDAATPGDQSAAVGDDSAEPGDPGEAAPQAATAEVETAETEAPAAEAVEPETPEVEAGQAPETTAAADEVATEAADVPSQDESSTVEQVVAEADGDAQPAEDSVTEEAIEDEATGDMTATADEAESGEAESEGAAEEPAVAADHGAEAGEASDRDPVAVEPSAEGDVDRVDEPPADDDGVVIDLVETETAQLQPEPDPVDQVLNALINRARQRNVGVAEVAAELVEQAALEDREVDEVLADLVVRSEDEADIHTSDRLTELTFFNDAVPRRPGELSQFERLGDTEKKRVIIRVLCLLVAQAEDSHRGPREPRSEAETRSWPLARAIWPVQTAEDPDDADLPARPVARSGR